MVANARSTNLCSRCDTELAVKEGRRGGVRG